MNEIAAKAGKTVQQSFSGVGDAIGAAVEAPVEQAMESLKKPMEAAKAEVEQTRDEIYAMCDAEAKRYQERFKSRIPEEEASQPKVMTGPKTKLASQIMPGPIESEKKPESESKSVKKISEDFKVASTSVGMLQQKLENVESLLEIQKGKVSQLTTEYDKIVTSKGTNSSEAMAVDQKATEAQGKLIALQQTAAQTREKLSKALDASAALKKTETATSSALGSMEKRSKKTGGAVKNAFKSVKTSISSAFKSAGNSAGKSLKSIQHKAGGLARSIKSAFKSAVLMAGLYAAFRGVKSLIGEAATQNKQFSDSLNLVEGNLMAAFAPIMSAIMPALNTLMAGLAAVTQKVAAFIAGLFGQTYAQATAAAKKMQDVSKSTKKAAGSLASFDELNVLNQKDKSGDDSAGQINYSALDMAEYVDVDGFFDKVYQKMNSFAASVGPWIAGLLTKIAEYAPQFIAAGATILMSFLSGFNLNAESITTSILSIINSLMNGLESILPQLIPFTVNFITLLAEGFLTGAPRLLSMGITMIAGVLQGLAQKMPELIPMAQNAVITVVQSIKDNLPQIVQSGIDILLSIIQGLAEMLPELIPMGMQIILDLITTLVNNIPQIIDTGIELLMGLIDGLLNAIPILIEEAPKIIQSLVTGLVDAIPKLVDAASEIITKLVDFIIDNLPSIIKAAFDILGSLAEGLLKAIPELIKAVPKIMKSLIDKIMSTDWLKVGKDIFGSIVDGIKSAVGKIGSGISGFFSGLFGGGGDKSDGGVKKYASGGVVNKPTLGLIGEYTNARSNPEWVMPEDKLLGTFNASMAPFVSAVIQSNENVVRAINEKDMNAYMDGELVSRPLQKHLERRQKIIGARAIEVI